MTADRVAVRRALLSVFDKTGIVEFARSLHELGIELVSSGGTAKAVADAGIPVTPVEQVTGAPEMLDHRVVTLHPAIHAGILADLGKESHRADLEREGIAAFELVVVNLYPFASQPGIETIDVGGPTMVRAAAKNHAWVTIVTDAAQYATVLDELRANDGSVSFETRRAFALDAFAHTAAFDAAIVRWMQEGEPLPRHLVLPLERAQSLRYGENPHQQGARYREAGRRGWWDDAVQHGGKELSYLNLFDTEAAWRLAHDLGDQPAVAIIKHANPCGAAVADDIATAYRLAHECDPTSAFGGIVAINRPVPAALAEQLAPVFTEVVVAPGYESAALEVLLAKKNLRVLEAPPPGPQLLDVRSIDGGLLVQEPDSVHVERDAWKVVTEAAPTDEQWRDLELAWRVCAYVKSNAIVIAANGQALGAGGGQTSRVDAAEIAVRKAAGRAVGGAAASDAFFPFRDGLDAVAKAGVKAVVQPGGSVRDDEVIGAADEQGIAMVFTGRRHFRH
ncbi:MAG: bifunctional phosphoribosylaminoimidazolecarboxamide formyltransferase/IMP cyclohydrolase [Acidimicrobiia bacterium]